MLYSVSVFKIIVVRITFRLLESRCIFLKNVSTIFVKHVVNFLGGNPLFHFGNDHIIVWKNVCVVHIYWTSLCRVRFEMTGRVLTNFLFFVFNHKQIYFTKSKNNLHWCILWYKDNSFLLWKLFRLIISNTVLNQVMGSESQEIIYIWLWF